MPWVVVGPTRDLVDPGQTCKTKGYPRISMFRPATLRNHTIRPQRNEPSLGMWAGSSGPHLEWDPLLRLSRW